MVRKTEVWPPCATTTSGPPSSRRSKPNARERGPIGAKARRRSDRRAPDRLRSPRRPRRRPRSRRREKRREPGRRSRRRRRSRRSRQAAAEIHAASAEARKGGQDGEAARRRDARAARPRRDPPRLRDRRLSLHDQGQGEGLSRAHAAAAGRTAEGAELDQGDRREDRHAVRGPRRRRQGRHDQALHGASQPARRAHRRAGEADRARALAMVLPALHRASAVRRARSCSSTAPGTIAPASSG